MSEIMDTDKEVHKKLKKARGNQSKHQCTKYT